MYTVKKAGRTKQVEEISSLLDKAETLPLSCVNWKEYPYRPQARTAMMYNDHYLFLKYWIEEDYCMALVDEDGGPVYRDSCVEFFVSPASDDYYYNFEFNCIGRCLLAYGNSRYNRIKAPLSVINLIHRKSSLGSLPFEEKKEKTKWNIFIAIPVQAFFRHEIKTFRKGIMKANFYKCGDGLTVPHYLSWSPIVTEKPDFHRPEFFNQIKLA